MSDQREMTLKEWVNKLPDFHLVNKEYKQLQAKCDAMSEVIDGLQSKVTAFIVVEGVNKTALERQRNKITELQERLVQAEKVIEWAKVIRDNNTGVGWYNPKLDNALDGLIEALKDYSN